jgi:hypothetical protein
LEEPPLKTLVNIFALFWLALLLSLGTVCLFANQWLFAIVLFWAAYDFTPALDDDHDDDGDLALVLMRRRNEP